MSCARALVAALLAIALVVATPLASIASCLRCPPDCPMHAVRAPVSDGAHGGHAGHARPGAHEHALHGGARDAHEDCHRLARPAPAPRPDDAPCIEATCGDHEPVIASVLPDAAVGAITAPAPARAGEAAASASSTRLLAAAIDPPSEPPRSSLG